MSLIWNEYIIDNSNTDTPRMRNTFVISMAEDLVLTEAVQDISLPGQPSQCRQATIEALLGAQRSLSALKILLSFVGGNFILQCRWPLPETVFYVKDTSLS